MINVKDQVYAALCKTCENVSDAYPSDWAHLPSIQYTEEDNSVMEFTNKEDKSYVRYKMDLWDTKSTSLLALIVDVEIAKLGLRRIACQDVVDPNGFKHKVMRYEGIIDNDTMIVYQKGQ